MGMVVKNRKILKDACEGMLGNSRAVVLGVHKNRNGETEGFLYSLPIVERERHECPPPFGCYVEYATVCEYQGHNIQVTYDEKQGFYVTERTKNVS